MIQGPAGFQGNLDSQEKIIVLYKLLQKTTGTITTKQQSTPPRNIHEKYRPISHINIGAKTQNKMQASISKLLKINIS